MLAAARDQRARPPHRLLWRRARGRRWCWRTAFPARPASWSGAASSICWPSATCVIAPQLRQLSLPSGANRTWSIRPTRSWRTSPGFLRALDLDRLHAGRRSPTAAGWPRPTPPAPAEPGSMLANVGRYANPPACSPSASPTIGPGLRRRRPRPPLRNPAVARDRPASARAEPASAPPLAPPARRYFRRQRPWARLADTAALAQIATPDAAALGRGRRAGPGAVRPGRAARDPEARSWVVLPGVSHIPSIDAPRDLVRILTDFATGH